MAAPGCPKQMGAINHKSFQREKFNARCQMSRAWHCGRTPIPFPRSHPSVSAVRGGKVSCFFWDEEVAFGGLDDQRVIVIGPGLGPPTLKNAHSNATGGHSGVIVKC